MCIVLVVRACLEIGVPILEFKILGLDLFCFTYHAPPPLANAPPHPNAPPTRNEESCPPLSMPPPPLQEH